jgi:hypothetical protein
MGAACGTYGGEGRWHVGFCWEELREREHLKELHTDIRILLKWSFKIK